MSTTLLDPEARIAKLLDSANYELLLPRTDCGMVAATGLIKGNKVVVFASDPTIKGGALGIEGSQVIVQAYRAAMGAQVPVIGIWHSGGARLSDGVASLNAFGEVFQAMVTASGRIPQLSLVLGPTAGGGAYGPALTDVVVLAPEGRIFVTGPDVVKSVTGDVVDMALLGGPEAHSKNSGVAHVIAPTEEIAYREIQDLVSLFSNQGLMSSDVADVPLAHLVPDTAQRIYEVHPLVDAILDSDGEKIELLDMWAENMTTVIGRLGGRTVGVIANNPQVIGGVLDSAAGEKAARFVRFCDSFNVPLLVLVDVPGFLPGTDQEWNGIITNGAKLLYAFSEATVPRITVITRKAYEGAYDVMNSKHIGADLNYAWPMAEIAVMGAKGAAEIIFKKEIAEAEDSEAKLQEKVEEYTAKFANPYRAAHRGYIDEVILPSDTRTKLIKAFKMLENKVDKLPRKKHGNIPL